MTKEQLVDLIRLSVSIGDETAARKAAESALNAAIIKLSRTRNTSFNRDYQTFNLASGTGSYLIGSDILSGYPNAWNMNELWHTDTEGKPITIIGLTDFNDIARGGTTSGRPDIATIHSSKPVLQVYPIPDQAYTVIASVPKTITKVADIPVRYHDVLADVANLVLKAASEPEVALQLVRLGLRDVGADSNTNWTGDKILLRRAMGGEDAVVRANSDNLSAE